MSLKLEHVSAALAGRFEVERLLGRGGMSFVYAGRDPTSGAQVAIKVLPPEYAVTILAERFHREIAYLAKLHHPNILPLITSGEAEGLLYYAMPFADGGTLEERLERERRLDVQDALRITHLVAQGIDYAHGHNVLHRDIKPGNVIFGNGSVMVSDFGVARALVRSSEERISSSGIVVGTPRYMSPEQAAGKGEIDRRSDIYALACVVYEMLAGEPPFTGSNPQAVFARQIAQAPPSLRVVRPEVPEHLEVALLRALSKSPQDRPATAGELAAALLPPDWDALFPHEQPRQGEQARE
jgi:serine/threonine-protein kinase